MTVCRQLKYSTTQSYVAIRSDPQVSNTTFVVESYRELWTSDKSTRERKK